MPHHFFFNDCFPADAEEAILVGGLTQTLKQFRDLRELKPDVDMGIITHKLPAQCELRPMFMLNQALDKIENRDDRVYAYALFNRYPIHEYFNDENVELSRYRLLIGPESLDATNLAIAGSAKAFLFTVGVHTDLKKHPLYLTVADDREVPLNPMLVANLFGTPANTKQICAEIDERNLRTLGLYQQLLQIAGEYRVSKQFPRDFNSLTTEAQQKILEHLSAARARKGPTPFFADGDLVKDVTPERSKYPVMELRVFQGRATRTYFSEIDGIMYLAGIGYKNSGNQNNDISTARAAITKLVDVRI